MTRANGIFGSRKAMVLLAVAVAYAAWEAWLTLAAPGKIAAGFPPDGDRVNIRVTLPFAPERFHIQVFQTYGRVAGTDENTVEVRGVKRGDLKAVARPYWVRRVEPVPQGG